MTRSDETSRDLALTALMDTYAKQTRRVAFEDVQTVVDIYLTYQFDPDKAESELRRLTNEVIDGISSEADGEDLPC